MRLLPGIPTTEVLVGEVLELERGRAPRDGYFSPLPRGCCSPCEKGRTSILDERGAGANVANVVDRSRRSASCDETPGHGMQTRKVIR